MPAAALPPTPPFPPPPTVRSSFSSGLRGSCWRNTRLVDLRFPFFRCQHSLIIMSALLLWLLFGVYVPEEVGFMINRPDRRRLNVFFPLPIVPGLETSSELRS